MTNSERHISESALIARKESKEHEPANRLETDVYIIRHGTAMPAVEDGRSEDERDFERSLSPKGINEVKTTGQVIGEELKKIQSEGLVFMVRSSHITRAYQTLETAAGEIAELLGVPMSSPELPFPPAQGKFAYTTKNYAFPPFISAGPHKQAMERMGGRSGKEWKGGATLPEQWVRDPSILAKDLDAAGITDISAEDVIAERTENFTKNAAVWAKAGAVLRKGWENDLGKEKSEKKQKGFDVSDATPPRLVVLAGTHGAIVPESWLYEIIKEYESQTGEQISPALGYAEYFKVHLPAHPDETPTLEIHGKTIPVRWEMFKVKQK